MADHINVGMHRYYDGITEKMLAELRTISSEMNSNPGEKGRNNEFILASFLKNHLPTRYTVSTGKVVAADGSESTQTDLIIHDRLLNPEFKVARAFTIVPVECVCAVVSVKTTLNRSELKNAIDQVASVRRLPRTAAIECTPQGIVEYEETLRPRGYVFAFASNWKSPESADAAFRDVIAEYEDELRPNGVCILGQALMQRTPYTTETSLLKKHVLMHFFVSLTRLIDTFPKLQIDLTKYFEDYPGAEIVGSPYSSM